MSDRIVTLVGADGTEHTLHCASVEAYRLATNFGLHGLAPVALGSRQVATIPGERLESVRRLPRAVPLPIRVFADTEQELDDRLRALGRILSSDSDLRLIFTSPDGTARELTVRYADGADPITLPNTSTPHSVKLPLVFRAFDPDWRAVAEATRLITQTFDDGLYSGINAVDVDNAGDVDTWPEWDIRGPVQNVQAINLVTGEMWRITEVLADSDVLRIRTDPRQRGVWLNDVLDHTILDIGAQLWRLVPGTNMVDVRGLSLDGSNIGQFSISFRERFDSC